MAVNLSSVWGAGVQLFDNSGNILSGGKIYTYVAGTTTPATTYTDSTGLTPNSNPIILNSAGRISTEIWLTQNIVYKYILKDSNDVLIATYDNISGVNDSYLMTYDPATTSLLYPGPLSVKTAFDDITNESSGSSVIGFTQSGAGAVARTVESKLQDVVNVKDFGAVGDGATEDADAFISAINSLSNGGVVYVPPGEYIISSTVSLLNDVTILGEGTSSVILGHCSSDNTDSVNGLFSTKSKSNVTLDSLKIIPYAGSGGMRSKFILCDNVQIKNCYLDGDLVSGDISAFPIWFAGCTTAKVINHTSYNFRDHIYIAKSNWNTGTTCGQVDVIDSYFENVNLGTSHAYPTGVYTYYADYTNVTGCTFKNIAPSLAGSGYTGYGVYEGDGEAIEVNIKNCNFYKTVSSLGVFNGCISSTAEIFNVVGCSFAGTSSYKINAGVSYAGKKTIVDGCSFDYCNWGVFLSKTGGITGYKNWTVTNNNITNSVSNAIRLSQGSNGAANMVISNNNIDSCGKSAILFNSNDTYSIVCVGNLIRNANTDNGSTEPFESGINVYGGTPSGILSDNFVINDSGVGYARYGIRLGSAYPITITNTNSFSGMVTGGVTYQSAAPTTGTWDKGDTRWNWNATSGQPMGWVCTVAGTPGTWTAMPNLT